MPVAKVVRKRIHGLAEAWREALSYLYVIQIGWRPGCYMPTVEHASPIEGA